MRRLLGFVLGLSAGLLTGEVLTSDPSASEETTLVNYEVSCSRELMQVRVNVRNNSVVYLERLKGYPGCQPEITGDQAVFQLPLDNIYTCGTTKVVNKLTGQKIFYHRIVLEDRGGGDSQREVLLAKCVLPADHEPPPLPETAGRLRRDLLPANFSEPEELNITDYIVAEAPVPYLSVAIRQNGRVLDTTLGIQPGTPLEMVIYLDRVSAETYGLLASYLKVTDNTPNQEEVIIMNGCSIDPYIFGNFEALDDGDTLSAKFRAFKFPDTNYVLFVGTVSVCIHQCKGVPCGNNQIGYGRRKRREIPPELPQDPNKVFEVEMTAFLNVQPASVPTPDLNGPALPPKESIASNVANVSETKETAPYTQPSHGVIVASSHQITLLSIAMLSFVTFGIL